MGRRVLLDHERIPGARGRLLALRLRRAGEAALFPVLLESHADLSRNRRARTRAAAPSPALTLTRRALGGREPCASAEPRRGRGASLVPPPGGSRCPLRPLRLRGSPRQCACPLAVSSAPACTRRDARSGPTPRSTSGRSGA